MPMQAAVFFWGYTDVCFKDRDKITLQAEVEHAADGRTWVAGRYKQFFCLGYTDVLQKGLDANACFRFKYPRKVRDGYMHMPRQLLCGDFFMKMQRYVIHTFCTGRLYWACRLCRPAMCCVKSSRLSESCKSVHKRKPHRR